MKRFLLISISILIGCLIWWLALSCVEGWAGEKDELQWKARALVAEANLYQAKLNEAQKAIQEFIKELDSKGYAVNPQGEVIEKPKPAPQTK